MDYNKYQNHMAYPREIEFTKYFGYKNGTKIYEGDHPPTEDLGCAAVEKIIDKDAYRQAQQKVGFESARLENLFKQDLFEELEIVDNPKREKLYRLAWDKGHWYSEIYNEACNLVELIKED
jgi:hypothetical protein